MPNNLTRVDAPFGETVLLQGDAGLVASDTKRFFSRQRVERNAAQEERQRLGREVHDGALQALTAVSLQLAALSRLIESDPAHALSLVAKLDAMVTAEQRKLRGWLVKGSDKGSVAMAPFAELDAALETLCQRAESQWGLRVELAHSPHRAVPRVIADNVYRLVQEAIANAGKHARAAHAHVRLCATIDDMQLAVADDGVGFPFRGEYPLADLQKRGIGPRSLLQRVAALGGELMLTSTMSGSTLEIALPLSTRAHESFG